MIDSALLARACELAENATKKSRHSGDWRAVEYLDGLTVVSENEYVICRSLLTREIAEWIAFFGTWGKQILEELERHKAVITDWGVDVTALTRSQELLAEKDAEIARLRDRLDWIARNYPRATERASEALGGT